MRLIVAVCAFFSFVAQFSSNKSPTVFAKLWNKHCEHSLFQPIACTTRQRACVKIKQRTRIGIILWQSKRFLWQISNRFTSNFYKFLQVWNGFLVDLLSLLCFFKWFIRHHFKIIALVIWMSPPNPITFWNRNCNLSKKKVSLKSKVFSLALS